MNELINEFHRFYYESRVWHHTSWMGLQCSKCPLDIWVYQEIIVETKPDIIIECGTGQGGSSLFLASICSLLNKGRVITIDIVDRNLPEHYLIKQIIGSSIDVQTLGILKSSIHPNETVMVILDSDHTADHVFRELLLYSPLVTKNCYLIVEDSNINGHPVTSEMYPGPMEAIELFMKNNEDFIIDKNREKFFLTMNPNGYLKKVK